ncbi:MAG: endonuclease/exonuclease/phosphatase family protein [Polyangiaceae bacterium]|nr:endonuclease/exonuclease/phosphatase family protein [Polyangiaceae bacterium]
MKVRSNLVGLTLGGLWTVASLLACAATSGVPDGSRGGDVDAGAGGAGSSGASVYESGGGGSLGGTGGAPDAGAPDDSYGGAPTYGNSTAGAGGGSNSGSGSIPTAPSTPQDPVIVNVETGNAFDRSEIVVIDYNMLHPGPIGTGENEQQSSTADARLELLAAAIAAVEPDVVLLQEVAIVAERRGGHMLDRLRVAVNSRLSGTSTVYNSVYNQSNISPMLVNFADGNAVLTKYEVLSAETIIFDAQARTGGIIETRTALRVTISGANGDLDFISCHLKGDFADEQTEEILAHFQGRNPLVIAGDFNVTPSTPAYSRMTSGGFVDTYVVANGSSDFTSDVDDIEQQFANPTQTIDYIFARDYAEVISSALFMDEAVLVQTSPDGWLWGSDHIGVITHAVPNGYAAQ